METGSARAPCATRVKAAERTRGGVFKSSYKLPLRYYWEGGKEEVFWEEGERGRCTSKGRRLFTPCLHARVRFLSYFSPTPGQLSELAPPKARQAAPGIDYRLGLRPS